MKRVEQHRGRLFTFLAIFLLYGNMAMAKNTLDYKHQVVFAIQDDNQEKPFVFNQITIGEASQTVSPQEHFGLGQIGIHSSSQAASFAGVSCLYKSSFFLQDKRKQIYLYLFPFHFFW